jgi:hypothetical protein
MANVKGFDDYDVMPQITGIDIVPSGGTVGQVLAKVDGTSYNYSWQTISAGDISGTGSSVDNELLRWDGVTGTLVQGYPAGSSVFFTDTGELNIVSDTTSYNLFLTNNTDGGNYLNVQNFNSNDALLLTQDTGGDTDLLIGADNGDVILQANSTGINTEVGSYNISGVDVIVPSGGTAGQVLEKIDGTSYNMQWATPTVGDVTAAANITDNSIVRGDGGAKGVQDSDGATTVDWTIGDDGQLIGIADVNGDYAFTIRNLDAVSGNGFSVTAGEALGDIAFHIGDSDDSFSLLELEADQGHFVLHKTYAQTLIDNGVVYGMDIQSSGVASDFNAQGGTYRIAGVDIVMPAGGTTGQVLQKVNGTDYNTQWASAGGGIPQILTDTIGQGSTTANVAVDATPTITDGVEVASITITPGATANWIELSWNIIGDISADRAGLLMLFRGSTLLTLATLNDVKRGWYGSFAPSIWQDNPNTTSATTYSIRLAISGGGTLYYGQDASGDDFNGTLPGTQRFFAKEMAVG